jgi:hypothetical protein
MESDDGSDVSVAEGSLIPKSDDQLFIERHARMKGFNLSLFCLELREASSRYHIRKWEERTGKKFDSV